LIYGIRTIVAVEPLVLLAFEVSSRWEIFALKACAYNAPRARIKATETLVRGFIARSQTRKIGRIPNVPMKDEESVCASSRNASTNILQRNLVFWKSSVA
jgi:hypothetical protein